MRQRHFSRLWKKLTRHIPEFFWRKPMFKEQASNDGMRAQSRRVKFSKERVNRHNPLKRQTKQMRRGER
jgi:hypothetical protein